MQKNKDPKKTFLRELKRKEKRLHNKLERKRIKNSIKSKLKKREKFIEKYKESEIRIFAYMYKMVHGKMPDEGESLDMYAVKKLCKDFINVDKSVEQYEPISRFAKRKIKEITEIQIAMSKYAKIYKLLKTIYKFIVLRLQKCYNYFIRINKSHDRKTE